MIRFVCLPDYAWPGQIESVNPSSAGTRYGHYGAWSNLCENIVLVQILVNGLGGQSVRSVGQSWPVLCELFAHLHRQYGKGSIVWKNINIWPDRCLA